MIMRSHCIRYSIPHLKSQNEPNDLLYPSYAARLPPPRVDDALFIFHQVLWHIFDDVYCMASHANHGIV